MTKLTREQKIAIYTARKQGSTIRILSEKYNMRADKIKYLTRLIDYHGVNILRKDKNKYYSPALKQEIINDVLLLNHSRLSTSIKYGLSSCGMLTNWIKSYNENECVIVEKTRGRSSTMKKEANNIIKSYEHMTPEEKIKFLENKNQYLEAENEYLKKLRAVVQTRKNQQLKKK